MDFRFIKEIDTVLSNIILPVLIISQKDRTVLYSNTYAKIQYGMHLVYTIKRTTRISNGALSKHKCKESTINIEKGMKFYCSTDGYFGQTGEKKGFTNIIKEYYSESMAERQEIFLCEMAEYEEMIEHNERNDDITLIAFTI